LFIFSLLNLKNDKHKNYGLASQNTSWEPIV